MLRGIHSFLDKSNWEDARKVVDSEDLSIPGGFGQWTPHHIACKRNAPVDIIKSLINSCPESLDKFDASNRLPIHYAADCVAPVEVFEALVEASPKSILGVDNDMKTPLHIMLQNCDADGKIPPVDIIKILSSDPSAVWIADSEEKVPIHVAAEQIDHLSTEHFQTLVEADHNSVLAQTKAGMTALHLALQSCKKEIPIQTIKSLLGLTVDGDERLDADYEVTRVMSDDDLLPLHFACKNHTMISEEIFRLLLERCPESATTAASSIGFPLDVLESSLDSSITRTDIFNKKSDMIFAYNTSLMPYCMQADRLRRIGDTILAAMSKSLWLSDVNKSLWIWMCTLPDEENEECVATEVVETVLKAFKDSEKSKFLVTIQTISEDDKDLPLFELASSKIKEIMAPYLRVGKRFSIQKKSMTVSYDTVVFEAIDSRNKDSKVIVKLMGDKQKFEDQVLVHQNVQAMSISTSLPVPIVPMIAKYEKNNDETFFSDFQDFVNYDDMIDMTSFQHVIIQDDPGKQCTTLLNETEKDMQLNCKALAQMVLCLHNAGYAIRKLNMDNLCEKNGKIMLRNSSCLTKLTTPTHETYFGAIEDIETTNLPPEMIVKLSADEVQQYETYWRQVINEYLIASEFSKEDLSESPKFQEYLKESNCSAEMLCNRVYYNRKLWQKIRPRRVGDDYYVIKCFRYDSNKNVYNADSLPYDLVQRSKSLGVWKYASFIFEQVTGETLFHMDKNNNFINDSDYEKLFMWDMTNPRIAERMQNVKDPFARDFLRVSLTPTNTRLPTMKSVLEHNFFKYCEDDSQYSEIKKGYLALERASQQDLLLLEEMNHRTKRVHVVSTKVQIRFENSVWRQLQWDYKVDEVKFPAAFIFLPYELEYSGKDLEMISSVNESAAQNLSLAVLDVLHYVNLVQTAKTFDEGLNLSHADFIDSNATAAKSLEKKPLSICRDILAIWNNTKNLLSNYFELFLPSDRAKMVSHKLISDSLRGVIDYETCSNISSRADEVLDVIASLVSVVGKQDKEAAENISNKYLSEICSGHFDLTLEIKDQVYTTLSTLFEKFTKSPLKIVQLSFDSAFLRLLECYSNEKYCYVYPLDEFVGKPVVLNDPSTKIALTSDAMKAFIPSTLLAAKAHFYSGLDQLFGHNETQSVIVEQNICWLGNFSKSDCHNELLLIQNALNDNLRSRRNFDCGQDILKYLEDYHHKCQMDSKFFSLYRLLSPNNLLVWAEKESWMIALVEIQRDLKEVMASSCEKVLPRKNRSLVSSNELVEGSSHATLRKPLLTIKCDESSPEKSKQALSIVPHDNNNVDKPSNVQCDKNKTNADEELIKPTMEEREGESEISKQNTDHISNDDNDLSTQDAVKNTNEFSSSDSNTEITDDYCESVESIPILSKSEDSSEQMYYSSTDSEKDEEEPTPSKNSDKDTSTKGGKVRSKRKKLRLRPGESSHVVSRKNIDVNRFQTPRKEIDRIEI